MSERYAIRIVSAPGSYFFNLQEEQPLVGTKPIFQFAGTNSFHIDVMATCWARRTASGTIVSSNWVSYGTFTGADVNQFKEIDSMMMAAWYLRVNSVVGSLAVSVGR